MDEIAIYNKALNPYQVDYLCKNGVQAFEDAGQPAAIPEPASMLFALAGLGFAIKRRRRS